MEFEPKRICLLGCGFLGSYIIGPILPFCSKLILWDMDRIQPENYENALYPKGMMGQLKVSALAKYLQFMTSIPIQPFHQKFVGNHSQLEFFENEVDLVITTLDNIKGRRTAQTVFDTADNNYNIIGINKPHLQAGLTENYGLVDWDKHYPLPQTLEEIEQTQKQLVEMLEVCERIEFRTLGAMLATITVRCVEGFIVEGIKEGCEIGYTTENTYTRWFKR